LGKADGNAAALCFLLTDGAGDTPAWRRTPEGQVDSKNDEAASMGGLLFIEIISRTKTRSKPMWIPHVKAALRRLAKGRQS
jgi:hypothetical protein